MPTLTERRDPFAAIRALVPGRYAPGFTWTPYDYPDRDRWYPVIYYPHFADDESRVWLVEPFPAARADGTDGLDEIDESGARIGVLTRAALPRPLVDGDLEGDHIVPQYPRGSVDVAYDVYATNQADLMAAWCEAHAVASALNNRQVEALRLQVGDVEVLMAAERHELTGDSRFAGTIHEVRWLPVASDRAQRVPIRQVRRLRDSVTFPLLQPISTRDRRAARAGEFSSAGREWIETTYGLTSEGAKALDAIRRSYVGPTRCRVCGCTEERACPGRCGWVPGQGGAGDLCTACAPLAIR